MGLAYREGRGTRRSLVKAHQWLNIAASSGSRRAREVLAELESSLSPEEIAEAEFLAWEWYQKRNSP